MFPYSRDVFNRLVGDFNAELWPAQIAVYGALAVLLWLIFRSRHTHRHRWASALLALTWIAAAVLFHIRTLSALDWAAPAFGVFFLIQGGLIAWRGAARGRLEFVVAMDARGIAGLAVIVLALLIYPAATALLSGNPMQAGIAGLTPVPTVLLTLGLLLLAKGSVPVTLLIIPVLWSTYVGLRVWSQGWYIDLLLPVAALLAVLLPVLSGGRRS